MTYRISCDDANPPHALAEHDPFPLVLDYDDGYLYLDNGHALSRDDLSSLMAAYNQLVRERRDR